jgi:hypothetical protein
VTRFYHARGVVIVEIWRGEWHWKALDGGKSVGEEKEMQTRVISPKIYGVEWNGIKPGPQSYMA